MKVVYFGAFRDEYSRNRINLLALQAVGVQVVMCHEPLWLGVEDRVQAAVGGWLRPAFWLRAVRVYWRLLWRGLTLAPYDVLLCGYPGVVDVYLARLLSWLRRKPLVWDVFMSVYLISLERGLDKRSRMSIALLKQLERLALRLPDQLIQDTRPYVEWLSHTFDIHAARFSLVPTGADETVFHADWTYEPHRQPFTVIYYGSYIPNHDAPLIARAAVILNDEPGIQFVLIGDGPQRSETQAIADGAQAGHIHFLDWMPQEALIAHLRTAGLVLGAFGSTPQSLMTVHNKVFEALALGLPVLTGDSAAVREALAVGSEIAVCPRGDPAALADAITRLRHDPELRAGLARAGQRAFQERYSLQCQGERLVQILNAVTRQPGEA